MSTSDMSTTSTIGAMRPTTTVTTAGRTGRRSVSAIAVAGLLVLATLAFAAAPAAAHGVNTNGCTGVPDSGYGFDFHEQCDDHDRCYSNQPYGSDWRGRRACDREFRSAMLGYCKRHDWFTRKRTACDTVAVSYYVGVRTLGWPFWLQAEPTTVV